MYVIKHEDIGTYFQAFIFNTVMQRIFEYFPSIMTVKNVVPMNGGKGQKVESIFSEDIDSFGGH